MTSRQRAPAGSGSHAGVPLERARQIALGYDAARLVLAAAAGNESTLTVALSHTQGFAGVTGRSTLACRFKAGESAGDFGATRSSRAVVRGSAAAGVKPSRTSTPSSRRYEAASATSSASDFRTSLACDFSSIGNGTHYDTNVPRVTASDKAR